MQRLEPTPEIIREMNAGLLYKAIAARHSLKYSQVVRLATRLVKEGKVKSRIRTNTYSCNVAMERSLFEKIQLVARTLDMPASRLIRQTLMDRFDV